MVSLQIHYTIQVASEPVFIDDLWDSSDVRYCSFEGSNSGSYHDKKTRQKDAEPGVSLDPRAAAFF